MMSLTICALQKRAKGKRVKGVKRGEAEAGRVGLESKQAEENILLHFHWRRMSCMRSAENAQCRQMP